MHNPLIDSTEMYVRTVWELEEEGIPPIRARLSERLGLSAPAVSETVSRLEEEGLLRLTEDRTLELTDEGRHLAVSVMRKHRLAERLLTDVIGLDWRHVHAEACRWEHVISDEVEQRLVEILDAPEVDAHGNPIPGVGDGEQPPVRSLWDTTDEPTTVTIVRFSEQLQNDPDMMGFVADHELRPGTSAEAERGGAKVVLEIDGDELVVSEEMAHLIYVR
ncbi:MAG: metal-dependent transcriptional regulator [Actinobacteria bacterium]|nr:metal-dependent transcriptional regulator [Actinomycetota bacterium]